MPSRPKAKNLKLCILTVTTWEGISPTAQHYYGALSEAGCSDSDFTVEMTLTDRSALALNRSDRGAGGPRYEQGQRTSRFLTQGSLEEVAISIWREKFPRCDVLVEGEHAILDPQRPLDAKSNAVFRKLKDFWDRAEKIGWFEGDKKAMNKLYSRYRKWGFGETD